MLTQTTDLDRLDPTLAALVEHLRPLYGTDRHYDLYEQFVFRYGFDLTSGHPYAKRRHAIFRLRMPPRRLLLFQLGYSGHCEYIDLADPGSIERLEELVTSAIADLPILATTMQG